MTTETYKKWTEDFKTKFSEILANDAMKKFMAETKDAGEDSGTFNVVVSTEDRDRQNDIVKLDGWDLSFYQLNPVVLWAHDYGSLPIGTCTSIKIENGKLVASGKFAPEAANPMAQQVRRLYDLGMVKTTSVGFIPTEYDSNDRDIITKAQLLEFSFVPVPANPYALSLRQIKELNINVPFLMTKGLNFDIKEKEMTHGDSCQMDDGTPGILGHNSNNSDGPMVCMPKKSMEESMSDLDKAIECYKSDHVKNQKEHEKNHAELLTKCKETVMECMKGIAINDGMKSGTMETINGAIVKAFDDHMEKINVENQRHSKECMKSAQMVHNALASYRSAVKEYVDGHGAGDDVGGNATADAVRMMHAVKDAFEHIALAHTALKAYAEAEGGKGSSQDDPDNQPDNQDNENSKGKTAERSNNSTKDFVDEVNAYVTNKEFLKQLSITLGKSLRKLNREDNAKK